jgi:sugar O-acyltransferase (sialic acid O-acetyltransferase NeuD family)
MKNPYVIVGAGGHAKVVLDAARAGGAEVVAVFDDNPALWGELLLGIVVRGAFDDLIEDRALKAECQILVAIGDNTVRQGLQLKLENAGWCIGTVIHPSANVSPSVQFEPGCIVMAGVTVNADSWVGKGAIINTGANVDHENRLGEFVHVGPASTLCGNVLVRDGAFIGAGATVVQGLEVGEGAIVGAGAVVVKSVPAQVTVVGVPAC